MPQLQSTFLKALQDTGSRKIRLCAGGALARLIPIHTRTDVVALELIKFLNASTDNAVIETTLIAMRAIVIRAQSKISANVLDEAVQVAVTHQQNETAPEVAQAASALRGELALQMNQLSDDFILSMIFPLIFTMVGYVSC
ncbi:unnamed protein product [Gongylonema pulchrum]|uniref:Uncharacterized protein n=1 Tax=Gongylonema pulchrum TaxID=637853 RepID=A0A3P7NN53_9BILA|nr:unnamed protein product [Gongylonema pulchrum]